MQGLFCGKRLPASVFCPAIMFVSLDGGMGRRLGTRPGSWVVVGWLLAGSRDPRGITFLQQNALSYLPRYMI